MATITITIDVLNSSQIVKTKKGFFMGLIASIFLSKKRLKEEVEKKICEKIIEELKGNLNTGLTNEGVEAKILYSFHPSEQIV